MSRRKINEFSGKFGDSAHVWRAWVASFHGQLGRLESHSEKGRKIRPRFMQMRDPSEPQMFFLPHIATARKSVVMVLKESAFAGRDQPRNQQQRTQGSHASLIPGELGSLPSKDVITEDNFQWSLCFGKKAKL